MIQNLEKWISELNSQFSDVDFQIVDGETNEVVYEHKKEECEELKNDD